VRKELQRAFDMASLATFATPATCLAYNTLMNPRRARPCTHNYTQQRIYGAAVHSRTRHDVNTT
jgi:hypothetical protein